MIDRILWWLWPLQWRCVGRFPGPRVEISVRLAEDTAAAEAHVKSNSPARAVPGRPAGLTVLGTRDYIKYVPNRHAGATAEEAPADYSLSDSGGGGVLYPPLDGRAAEQHLPPHAARRRPDPPAMATPSLQGYIGYHIIIYLKNSFYLNLFFNHFERMDFYLGHCQSTHIRELFKLSKTSAVTADGASW
ncbi:hypothetical protein QTP88_012941 [Uroleucon formosanum]